MESTTKYLSRQTKFTMQEEGCCQCAGQRSDSQVGSSTLHLIPLASLEAEHTVHPLAFSLVPLRTTKRSIFDIHSLFI